MKKFSLFIALFLFLFSCKKTEEISVESEIFVDKPIIEDYKKYLEPTGNEREDHESQKKIEDYSNESEVLILYDEDGNEYAVSAISSEGEMETLPDFSTP